MKQRSYVSRVIRSFSITFNVLLGGYENQTFAARNYDRMRYGRSNLVWLINMIHMNEAHCISEWVDWYTASEKFKLQEHTK